MSWTFTTPAAIDAILAAFRAAPGLAGVDVRDGPEIADETATEVLTVGWEGDDQGEAVEATLVQEGQAASPDRASDAIRCAVATLNGEGDISAARARVYQLVSAAGNALASDRRLGGTVMYAMITSAQLRQVQDDQGATATVVFTVECNSYTGR